MAPYERCAGYVLLRELGEDALGSVYRAGHVAGGAIDRLVLLRKLRAEGVAASAVAQAAAGREPLTRRVRSPYLGEPVELGACRGESFATYDYQPGVTVRGLLTLADDRLSPLSPDLAAVIADRVAQALMALWSAGEGGHGLVVPELVWVSTEGEVRLLGAEAAPALRRAAALHPELRPYVAPEARGEAPPVEADEVWSLGALLAALLTGVPPEPDEEGAWLSGAVLADDGSPLPEPIAELLGRSLVPRPQRLARVEAWHQALARALELVGWRAAPFQLAVFMHSLLKSEMKREPEELEREREEALRPPGSAREATDAAPAAALPPVARAATSPAPAPRLLGALGREETDAGVRERGGRPWLPWAAVAALAVVGGAAWWLLAGRDDGTARRAATTAPAPAPTPAIAAVPTPAPQAAATPGAPTATELEERLTALLAEREKTLSDRYAREVQELRDQLAESRRATAAAQARPPAASPARPETGRAEGTAPAQARPEPVRQAGATAGQPATAPPPAPAATAAAATPLAAQPQPAAPASAAAAPSDAPLVPPRLLRFDPPDYPQLARQRGVEGTVVLSVRVGANGQVSEVRFVRRVAQDVGINEAAAAAARRARFQPATRGGVPAEAWYTLTIPFQL